MNGYWLWVIQIQPTDIVHCNLLGTVLIYDNNYEEEEPSYDDFESRLNDKIGDSFETKV